MFIYRVLLCEVRVELFVHRGLCNGTSPLQWCLCYGSFSPVCTILLCCILRAYMSDLWCTGVCFVILRILLCLLLDIFRVLARYYVVFFGSPSAWPAGIPSKLIGVFLCFHSVLRVGSYTIILGDYYTLVSWYILFILICILLIWCRFWEYFDVSICGQMAWG